ncbi:MAG: NADH-quinone oxidoreductase subunit NuoB [Candidatus Eisenbacteria bacterium]|nr:NADH-quinone oxidoreductase subunit NuoB [Candidatus Eisenbacteria bacterium]
MHRMLKARLAQPFATVNLPVPPAGFPERYRGLPAVRPELCPAGCRECADVCPSQAIEVAPLRLDLGRCVFCGECARACPADAISFTRESRQAVSTREALVLEGAASPGTAGANPPGAGGSPGAPPGQLPRELQLAHALDEKTRSLFGRSLRLRAVCAGACNGCDAELVALGNVVFDLGRYGVQFVASPRHADGLVVTGPVTRNMDAALRETWEAVPEPKLVIAVGACAISGGVFRESPEQRGGVHGMLPVDLYVPGCPPHPLTILDGILRLLGRL